MDAIILAGGLGTRISHMISEPKALVRIDGAPLIDQQLHLLRRSGLHRIVLALGHKSQAIIDHVGAQDYGCEIVLSLEEKPLGTGGAIQRALSMVQSDPFFVLNGDTLHDRVDLLAMLEAHTRHRATITVGAMSMQVRNDVGLLVVGPGWEIVRFSEGKSRPSEGQMGWANAGVYLLQKEIFASIPAEAFSFERDVLPQCVAHGRCYIHPIDHFYDIGTPERLTAIMRGEAPWEE